MKRFVCLLALILLKCILYAQPPARHLERIAYDTKRAKLIMFGGSAMVGDLLTYYTSVYEWDGVAWTEFSAPGPMGRNGSALVFNPSEKCTYLLGGIYEDKAGYKILFDVWTWNGTSWQQVDTTCPVKEPEAVYDPQNKRVFVFGEASNKDSLFPQAGERKFELWSYKRNRWHKLSEQCPSPEGPIHLAFNPITGILVFPAEESGKMVVWQWNKEGWKKRACENACPPARSRYAFAFDAGTQTFYMHGGRTANRDFLNDLWEWNGETWKDMTPSSPLSKKASARMISFEGGILEYGGVTLENGKTLLRNDVWILQNGKWKK